jgi:hypothetical protein
VTAERLGPRTIAAEHPEFKQTIDASARKALALADKERKYDSE